MVSTKLYNKTLELREVHDKPYIRQAWFTCGLVDSPIKLTKTDTTGKEYTPQIWRLEFSIRSSVKNWFVIEEDGNARKKRSIRNTLAMYANRSLLVPIFASLTTHYFHFKKVTREQKRIQDTQLPARGAATSTLHEHGDAYRDLTNIIPRKDRCPDKELFRWRADETVYHVEHVASTARPHQDLDRLAAKLSNYSATHTAAEIRQAVEVIIRSIDNERERLELAEPWSRAELEAMRQALQYRIKHRDCDPATLISSLREFIAQQPEDIF